LLKPLLRQGSYASADGKDQRHKCLPVRLTGRQEFKVYRARSRPPACGSYKKSSRQWQWQESQQHTQPISV